MADMAKIKQSAVPKHLIEATTEELKNEAESKTNKVEEEIKELDDPKLEEKYAFDFEWKDGRGKLWSGHFVNKILSISEQQAMGVMRATLSGGVDFRSLDPFTSEINLIISHMTFSLIEFPEWAKDLRKLKDHRLVQNIYEEVASHEATFFGYNEAEENS